MIIGQPLYADHNATTPCDGRIVREMLPYFTQTFANPGSIHHLGRQADNVLQNARDRCAKTLHRNADEIVFTSGATEGLQLCLESLPSELLQGIPIFTTRFEHRAVQNCLKRLEKRGMDIRILECQDGVLAQEIITDAGIYVIQAANSETGVIQSILQISEKIHAVGGMLICDAAQGLWKLEMDQFVLGPDALILSAHKAYGPKGVGALVLQRDFKSILKRGRLGLAQDQGIREGTINVAGAVGMAATLEFAYSEGALWRVCAAEARSAFENRLSLEKGCEVHFKTLHRLPNTSSVRFSAVDGDVLTLNSSVAVSFGTACSSGSPEPSPVLLEMGLNRTQAMETVRVSFGRDHSGDDGNLVAEVLLEAARTLAAEREST
jgi:cysteine desulfurase